MFASRQCVRFFCTISPRPAIVLFSKRESMSSSNLHGSRYLAALEEHVLVFDGAMGTSFDTYNLTAADYGGERTHGNRDYLVITRPDIVEEIHRSFMEAGCDVLETCTFQATRLRLEEWGLAEQTAAINHAA